MGTLKVWRPRQNGNTMRVMQTYGATVMILGARILIEMQGRVWRRSYERYALRDGMAHTVFVQCNDTGIRGRPTTYPIEQYMSKARGDS